jgi:hypothetical protein
LESGVKYKKNMMIAKPPTPTVAKSPTKLLPYLARVRQILTAIARIAIQSLA